MFFISYFLTNVLEFVLLFLGTLNWSVFSVLSHSIGLGMSLLIDEFDIIITLSNLSWLVNFIGALLLVLNIKKKFTQF